MSGLQETFYIMAIIFMGLTFIIMLALVSAVFVIRSKVNKLHDTIETRLSHIVDLAEKSGELSALAGSKVVKGAVKALKKARK